MCAPHHFRGGARLTCHRARSIGCCVVLLGCYKLYKYSSLIKKRSIILPASGCRIRRQRVKICVCVYRRGNCAARGQPANKGAIGDPTRSGHESWQPICAGDQHMSLPQPYSRTWARVLRVPDTKVHLRRKFAPAARTARPESWLRRLRCFLRRIRA